MTRYISQSPSREKEMLSAVGVANTRELFEGIPGHIKLNTALNLPKGLSEQEIRSHAEALSQKNLVPTISFMGAGAYNHFIPSTVKAIISRSEFYTAYTPYQPEISQGALQTIYEFQTYIANLSGMDASNASVYDGASAVAEAASIACQHTGRRTILVSKAIHPQYRDVLNTYMAGRGVRVTDIPLQDGETDRNRLSDLLNKEVAGVIVQNPNFFGILEDYAEVIDTVHQNQSLFIVCSAEAFSLAALKSPGELGADIFAGEGQSLGLPVSFGGPGIGLLAVKSKLMRKLPGRIAGKTLDAEGKDCFVLTLQAREQHIRREKAGSNICTNQGLCSIAVAVYLSTLGNKLQELALQNMHKARYASERLTSVGRVVYDKPFFNEFVIQIPNALQVHKRLLEKGIAAGVPLEKLDGGFKDQLLLCFTELSTKSHIDTLVQALAEEIEASK